MRHYCGIDLLDVFRERISPREVLWLVEQLPHESATKAAITGNPLQRVWTLSDDIMLSGLVDAIKANAAMSLAPYIKGGRPPAVEPFPGLLASAAPDPEPQVVPIDAVFR